MDPPDDEPPSLKIESMEENQNLSPNNNTDFTSSLSPLKKPDIDAQGFFTVEPNLDVNTRDDSIGTNNFSTQYVSPESESQHNQEHFGGLAPAIDGKYAEESRSHESNHYRHENVSLTKHQYFQEPFGSHENDAHFQDITGTNGFQNEGFIQELDKSIQTEGMIQDPNEMNKSDEIFQEKIPQPHPDASEFPIDSRLHITGATEKEFDVIEEKKMGIEKNDSDSQLNVSDAITKDEIEKSAEAQIDGYPRNNIVESIDTSCAMPNSYCNDNSAPSPFSPAGMSFNSATDSRGHQSPAMRGAHEILKRNRRRRLEV